MIRARSATSTGRRRLLRPVYGVEAFRRRGWREQGGGLEQAAELFLAAVVVSAFAALEVVCRRIPGSWAGILTPLGSPQSSSQVQGMVSFAWLFHRLQHAPENSSRLIGEAPKNATFPDLDEWSPVCLRYPHRTHRDHQGRSWRLELRPPDLARPFDERKESLSEQLLSEASVDCPHPSSRQVENRAA